LIIYQIFNFTILNGLLILNIIIQTTDIFGFFIDTTTDFVSPIHTFVPSNLKSNI
jgi:hypothetical protein